MDLFKKWRSISSHPNRGVQDPKYRSRLRKELLFSNRIRSRIRTKS